MNCEDVERWLSAFIDGEIDPVRAADLNAHLHNCPRCDQRRDELELARRVARAALRPAPADRAPVQAALRATSDRRMAHRIWIPFGAGVAAATLLVWLLIPVLQLQGPVGLVAAPEKYVYHVDGSGNVETALQAIQFHLEAAPRAHVVVVTHHGGVDFLVRGATDGRGRPFAARVAALAERGVEFRVCANTLAQRRIARAQIVETATFVPSGIAEVGRLQTQEGYAYLKP